MDPTDQNNYVWDANAPNADGGLGDFVLGKVMDDFNASEVTLVVERLSLPLNAKKLGFDYFKNGYYYVAVDSATKELGFGVDMGQPSGLFVDETKASLLVQNMGKKSWGKRNLVKEGDKVVVANHFQTTKLKYDELGSFIDKRPLTMVLERKINFNTDTWNA